MSRKIIVQIKAKNLEVYRKLIESINRKLVIKKFELREHEQIEGEIKSQILL